MALTASWPADYGRDLGPSSSQSITSEAIGHAEDISDIITNIDPDLTYFLSRFGAGPDCESLSFSWLTEGLKPPKVNAHLEKEDYTSEKVGSLEGMENNVQKFVSSGYVTDWQEKIKKVYKEDEISRQLTNLYTQHARDIEYAIVNNDTRNTESGSTPAMTGGIPYFMKTQEQSVTAETTGSTFTTSTAHNLNTGDFIYLNATSMPTGTSKGTIYYVRLDGTTPTTKFTLYNTQKGAIENVSADKVTVTTAGTAVKIVKNNVVTASGDANNNFTLADVDKVMEMCFQRGGNPTIAVMSPANKKVFSKIVTAATTINRGMTKDRRLELVADVVQTDYGVITAETHRLYPDNRIDFMDLNYWNLRWLDRTHEVQGLPKKGSYKEFVIESSLGLEGTQPKASGALIGISRA